MSEVYSVASRRGGEGPGERRSAFMDAPIHPIDCMQGAFEESMIETTRDPGAQSSKVLSEKVDSATRRRILLEQEKHEQTHAARWRPKPGERYHPLWKLIAQIAFGVHLIHKQLAMSDEDVIRILQTHVEEVDGFLEKTVEDFDLAHNDVDERIECLKLPLQNMQVFDAMLDKRGFRNAIVEGNEKIEHIMNRTAKAMSDALRDVRHGLEATRELSKYLVRLDSTWEGRTEDQQAIYVAMSGNAEGWFKCFVNLQDKGSTLQTSLRQLGAVVGQMQKRAGVASRRNIGTVYTPGSSISDATKPCGLSRSSTPALSRTSSIGARKSSQRDPNLSSTTLNVPTGARDDRNEGRLQGRLTVRGKSSSHGTNHETRSPSHRTRHETRSASHGTQHEARSSSNGTRHETRSPSDTRHISAERASHRSPNEGRRSPLAAEKSKNHKKESTQTVRKSAPRAPTSALSHNGSSNTLVTSRSLSPNSSAHRLPRSSHGSLNRMFSGALFDRSRRDVHYLTPLEDPSLAGFPYGSTPSRSRSPGAIPQPTSSNLSSRLFPLIRKTSDRKWASSSQRQRLRPPLKTIPSDSAYASGGSESRVSSPVCNPTQTESEPRGGDNIVEDDNNNNNNDDIVIEHVAPTATQPGPTPRQRALDVALPISDRKRRRPSWRRAVTLSFTRFWRRLSCRSHAGKRKISLPGAEVTTCISSVDPAPAKSSWI